jgi:hypothetical protein
MKKNLIILLLSISKLCFCQKAELNWPLTTMINDVTFKDSKYDKSNVGCGFLLKYNNDTFAITAKHILIIAKTDSMKTTNFEGGLKQWTMYPKNAPEQTVIMEELLNEDTTDSLSWEYLMKAKNYYDFLIFKIKKNDSNVKPLELSKSTPMKGDTLYNLGWSYKDIEGPQRIYMHTFLESKGANFNMRKINAPENGGGLSGSPVINSRGQLVGIISGMDEDPITKEEFYSPCHTSYLTDFFENYYRNKK